ncbi:hypothetical protein [Streptomyces sp. B15]|uniref:hypothetical protein n=1 Tax=Streptomyces sp. B15 TaxID=1537797 RepID=UPI001B376AFE|nr:hypothetical protein [Streptomyces sp. B15]MBQ1119836.1 hypothetical protein [Streptomyces sp. B15]
MYGRHGGLPRSAQLLGQETAPTHHLGVATTSTRFFQTLSSALGTALFGTMLARVYEAQVPGSTTSAIAHHEGTAGHGRKRYAAAASTAPAPSGRQPRAPLR